MSPIHRLHVIVLVFLLAAPLNLYATDSALDQAAKAPPCSAPQYHQFDFWLGDWSVYDVGSTSAVARVKVDSVLGGCALRERYEEANGYRGESLSIYDQSRNAWHQSWFTNRGRLLVIEGKFESGDMVLSGSYTDAGGQPTLVRGDWKPVSDGVRETAVTSSDAGNTWKPWFDLMFRPNATSKEDDAKTLADLDTQYQAAVKRNDAATMAKILADDFILVTGSGKVYTKTDLLEEARSARVQYEHQEDTDQKVRIWGDTAVVTAKLWMKGTDSGTPFDKTAWFSDTYVRTPQGWRYVFGQSSLPLPH